MKLAGLLVVLMLSGVATADNGPPPPQQRGQLRALLLQHFDRNHDGRLGPRERRHAAMALRRISEKLMRGQMQGARGDMQGARGDRRQRRQRKFIQRFDRNGDGNVGPAEMPSGLADEMRPLDVDGDGWLQGDELP